MVYEYILNYRDFTNAQRLASYRGHPSRTVGRSPLQVEPNPQTHSITDSALRTRPQIPFLYELALTPDETHYTFVQQLVPAGTLVGTGQPVATLTDGAMEFHVPAPRQGLLVAWHVQHGDVIENRDPLARIVCEGEPTEVPAAVPYRLG